MAEWIAFFITIGTETINWLTSMQVLGVSLAGIMVGFFILAFLIRVLIYKP